MRLPLTLTLIAAAALSACDKQDQPMGLTDWQDAPPLLAGVDEGAVAPPVPDVPTASEPSEGRQDRRKMAGEGAKADGESRETRRPRRDHEPKIAP